jgi:tRNA threonylcarbamoyladenosine modification (KEOPS) complex  Pcc1 subunit
LKKTSNINDQVAIIQIRTSTNKNAKTIHQALKPEIHTSNLEALHVKVQKTGNFLIFHFKSNNLATLRALINSYLRWVITLNKSIDIIDMKNSTLIS